jgi:hypothetical protein
LRERMVRREAGASPSSRLRCGTAIGRAAILDELGGRGNNLLDE